VWLSEASALGPEDTSEGQQFKVDVIFQHWEFSEGGEIDHT
jgi:hypothetical protein